MKTERVIVPFDVKALGSADTRTFEGYGSVFNVLDSYADIVAPGAFARSLSEAKAAGRMPALLWQHDAGAPVGIFESMHEDKVGLYVKGRLSDTQLGREAYTLLKDGALSGLSIGFTTRKSTVDNETGIRTLTDVQLWETSLVTFPANDSARVTGVKADGELPAERDFEEWLRRDAGLSRAEAKRVIATCYRRLLCDAADPTHPTGIAGRHVEGHQREALIGQLNELRSVLRAGAPAHGPGTQGRH